MPPLYSPKPGLLIGFHGCEKSVRNNIVSGISPLKISQNIYDWLGNGCYFWEGNYDRALEFAQNHPANKKIKEPAVLGAVIDLQNCLDLLETRYLKLVKESYANFISSGTKSDQVTIKNSGNKLRRELDCAVIEYLHTMQQQVEREPFDSIRGVFVEGEELYPNSAFHEKNHIQICIRNPNCIKGLFIPRKEIDWKGAVKEINQPIS